VTRLHVIVASTRPGRVGRTIAEWFVARAERSGDFDDVRLVDLAEVGLPFLDEPDHPSSGRYVHAHTRRWSASVAAADAFALVTPEYNSGAPAPLKNALDFLYREWHDKPVGFVSYGGSAAGTHAVHMLLPVLRVLRMVPVKAAVALPLRRVLDADGVLHPDQSMEDAAAALLRDLARLASALAPLRAAEAAYSASR